VRGYEHELQHDYHGHSAYPGGKEVSAMTPIGTVVSVGSIAPETGRYRHLAKNCPNTIILNAGNKVPPCNLEGCPDKGADWKLTQVLT